MNSEDEAEILDGDADVLEEIVKTTKDNRLAPGTKRNYASKLAALRNFVLKYDSTTIFEDNDDLIRYLNENQSLVDKFVASKSYQDPQTRTGMRSKSTIDGYVAGIKDLYRNARDPSLRQFPEELNKSFAEYVSGFRKTRAIASEQGQVKQTQGELPLSAVAYKTIARKALQISGRTSVFAHLYGVLSWNLIQRAVTIAGIHSSNIFWKEDALMIHISRHKGDQTGASAFATHCYANPIAAPECCPVLGMAIYLFTGRCRGEADGIMRLQLFEEDEKTYSKWLRDRLSSGALTPQDLDGCSVEDLGTHSYRKGATTYADSCPGGPSGTAVDLRAGWREGRSRERYTYPTEGQDQYLGRMLALLPIVDMRQFCILPPHFHKHDLRYVEIMTVEAWEEVIQSYQHFADGFKTALQFMLASLVYAFKTGTLSRIANPAHPLFSSRLFTGRYLERLQDIVVDPKVRICKDCGMSVTGIPVHWWMHMDSLERILDAVNSLKIGIHDMPEKVATMIQQRVELGAQHLTSTAVEGILAPIKNQLDTLNQQLQQQHHSQAAAVTSAGSDDNFLAGYNSDESTGNDDALLYDSWSWNGKMNMFLPPDFRFPATTCSNLWDVWFYGDCRKSDRRIRPFRKLIESNLNQKSALPCAEDEKLLSKAGQVIDAIVQCAIEAGILSEKKALKRMEYKASKEVFKHGYMALLRKIARAKLLKTTQQTALSSTESAAAVEEGQVVDERAIDLALRKRKIADIKFPTIYNDICRNLRAASKGRRRASIAVGNEGEEAETIL